MRNIYSFTGARKIVFGNGSFDSLADYLNEFGAGRPLVVLDRGLSERGFTERLKDVFGAKGVDYVVFDDMDPEPALESADKGAKVAIEEKCDIIIGVGGGSAMDLAKAISVLAKNGGEAKNYLGLNMVPGPGLPKIMVPTTAGTGSEVTFTSVFIRKDLKKKQGMNSPYLYPDLALLDPVLTLTVPSAVTATTGIDALCHAIESYTSIIASPMSEMFSLQGIGLMAANLRTCVHDGSNLEARSNQLMGSLYAGLGLANAGVTAVHSLSYPLGGQYGVPHGLANTLLLSAVMRYNVPGALEKFAAIAEVMGEITEGFTLREQAEFAVDAVETLILDCGIETTLSDVGVTEEVFPQLAEAAMAVDRPLANNPRKVTIEDAIDIYRDAF